MRTSSQRHASQKRPIVKAPFDTKTPWPIVRSHRTDVSDAHWREAKKTASSFDDESAVSSITGNIVCGWAPGPTLYFEDHRGTALVTEQAARRFEYRMLGLAGDHDLYLVTSPRNMNHETYFQTKVDLGSPTIIAVDVAAVAETGNLALACLEDRAVFDTIVTTCRTAGTLNIAPYQMSYGVWTLGRAIAKAAGFKVRIIGPPTSVSHFANNKTKFVTLVTRLLGKDACPLTSERQTPVGLEKYLSGLAHDHQTLVIKHPSSAGGLGNLKIKSSELLALPTEARRHWLREKILRIGWRPGQIMLAGVWVDNVSLSPSVQMWIPLTVNGPPIVEGIFMQTVNGDHAAFTGAMRVVLNDDLTDRMVSEATRIGLVYQSLGYYGRLSLDSVLVDTSDEARRLKWIEANARWGGVSIPMTICNRITGGLEPCDFQVVQEPVDPNSEHVAEPSNVIRLLPKESDLHIAIRLEASKLGWSQWPN